MVGFRVPANFSLMPAPVVILELDFAAEFIHEYLELKPPSCKFAVSLAFLCNTSSVWFFACLSRSFLLNLASIGAIGVDGFVFSGVVRPFTGASEFRVVDC